MFSRRLKIGYFMLEGMNSFATVYYLYYFFFFMERRFGFDNKANLALAALNGGVYAVFSWFAGKLARRLGYFNALKLGFLVMMSSLGLGLLLSSAAAQILVMLSMVMGMCFTWPTLEALISEGEPAGGVQRMVGVYNMVWAGTAALANFTGGAMLEHLGPSSLFYVPIGVQFGQLSLTFWLESQAHRVKDREAKLRGEAAREFGPALAVAGAVQLAGGGSGPASGVRPGTGAAAFVPTTGFEPSPNPGNSEPAAPGDGRAPGRGQAFLKMAWLANPFAYIAINTLIATIPGVALRLKLSTMLAGFCCSVWCFARLGAFFGLWFWNGWHYRFRWLLLSYVTLIASFAAILLTPSLVVVVLAQITFGGAIGLIYYSSLFYSMDQSDTKSEHGGIHEAAIGLGNCAGPAVGAAALHFVPQQANSGSVAVTLLLVGGLGGLLALWRKGRPSIASLPSTRL